MIMLLCATTGLVFGQDQQKTRNQKKEEHKQKIRQLIKEEEEGALIFSKQSAFGIKLNTDGYGVFYEHGKYKDINHTGLWWLELGERKSQKEEKLTRGYNGFEIGNPFIFGKINNFYYFKAGIGQQRLIGGKGNKNGVAVTAIYGAGLSAGFLKPYYLSVQDETGNIVDVKYSAANDSTFRDKGNSIILGASGISKGFSDAKFVPGAHARVALRFDYGRYNELLSAVEVGLNAEYYSKNMQIMLDNEGKKFFFNAYVALAFGKRK